MTEGPPGSDCDRRGEGEWPPALLGVWRQGWGKGPGVGGGEGQTHFSDVRSKGVFQGGTKSTSQGLWGALPSDTAPGRFILPEA